MSVWLVRAGKHGEHEERFFRDNRIYLTWEDLSETLAPLSANEVVREYIRPIYPDIPTGKLSSWTGQIGAFLFRMKLGDVVVTPRKGRGQYAVGEITGDYTFDPTQPMLYRHYRTVKWINLELPKASLDIDLQYSLNAIATICGVNREHAHERVFAAATGKAVPASKAQSIAVASDAAAAEQPELESLAKTQIAQHIIKKFKGHRLAELVGAILEAQGYTTFVSPPGADGGIDILAAPPPLGFGRPRLCVQVKSGDSATDAPTVNQLIGAMQNSQADQGLFVSWGGFKDSVIKGIPSQFFRVRLWDQDDLIQQLLDHYEKLSPDLKAELPLKRIWSLAVTEDEGEA
jgi:restriction system protein